MTISLPSVLRRLALIVAGCLALSLWLAPSTFAQGRGLNPERLAAQRDTLVKQLDLTDEQLPPVQAILEENDQKRMELVTEARESGSFMGMREQMAALNEETETRLGEVLTEEQMATYKKIQEERAAQRRGRRGGNPPGNLPR